jgi:hypothetical protein
MPIPVTTIVADTRHITDALAEYGIVTVPGWLPADAVAAVTADAERLLANEPGHAELLGYSRGKGVRVERGRLGTDYPALAACFSGGWMQEVADVFFGTARYAFNHDVIVVRDVVGTEHAARRPHYDRTPNLKFFLYLVDTAERNGAFCCQTGSHIFGKSAQAANRAAGVLPAQSDTRVLPDEFTARLEPVEGPAGTLLVIDSDIVHRGAPVLEGYRLAVRSRCYDPSLG